MIRPAQEKPFDGRHLLCHISCISFAQEGEVKLGEAPPREKERNGVSLLSVPSLLLWEPRQGGRLLYLSLSRTLMLEMMSRSCKTTELVLLGGLCFGLQQDGMKCRAIAQSACLLLLRVAECKTDCIHVLSLEAPCSCYKE